MKKNRSIIPCVLASALLGFSSYATADQLILDDLIVDGSVCTGFDCVNGESFGFDTIRLKENNLRIKFQDTSSSASFPTNDWQITANDSSNGGANKFSIDDVDHSRTPFTIEAGAPSHSLYVDDGGRVGFGTSTPVVELHVKDGDTPTLRLEQDGSSGFTPQTWDVAGNEANFFIRDVSNGSTLPFRIRPGAPTSSIDIASSGNVGVGTSSPEAGNAASRFMEIKNTGSASLVIDANTTFAEVLFEEDNTPKWSTGHAVNDDRFYVFNYPNNREDLSIDNATGVVTAHNGLTVSGGCTGCDAVFSPDWKLESIERHADFMFANSYLPGVGPTPEGQVTIDVFNKTVGILQELEKAHIYIAQINNTVKKLEERLNIEKAQK